jgi:hypothetical protein
MTVGASLYEPINVFKPMGPDIGIVDGPFEYLTVGGVTLPLLFTTRMTVVRLSNGNLCLQSPIKFVEVLASELQRMGTIRHLVSPNQFHYAHMVVESLSRCDPMGFTACTPKSARSAHRCHVCARPRLQSPRRMAARHRPDAISRWVFQRVHFLSQEIEDAGSRGHDYQHRVGQDARALANGDKVQRDVPSPRANILWHAAASIIAAARG